MRRWRNGGGAGRPELLLFAQHIDFRAQSRQLLRWVDAGPGPEVTSEAEKQHGKRCGDYRDSNTIFGHRPVTDADQPLRRVWRRGGATCPGLRDGEVAEQFQRAIDICALKVWTIDSVLLNNQHHDSPPCLRRLWSSTQAPTTSVRAHSRAHKSSSGRLIRGSCGGSFG